MYRHVIPASDRRTEDCPYFDLGFCKLSQKCQMSHVQKKVCVNYLIGFCPKGPSCLKEHVKLNLGERDLCLSVLAKFGETDDWVDSKMVQRAEKEKLVKN